MAARIFDLSGALKMKAKKTHDQQAADRTEPFVPKVKSDGRSSPQRDSQSVSRLPPTTYNLSFSSLK
jgi:hypothetical protein